MTSRTIKVIVRSLLKRPAFTIINSIGLTLGLMAFFFMMQYVVFQWSFNSMYAENERTYRLLDGIEGKELTYFTAPGIVPRAKENIPGIELAARFMPSIGSGIILIDDQTRNEQKSFREDELAFVDDDFLRLFALPVVRGTPDLTAPNTMVLTQSAAKQYFQTTDVVGESLTLINQFGEHPFQITAVVDDFPVNSDIQTNVLASMPTMASEEYIANSQWMDINTLESSFVRSFFRLSDEEVKENLIAYRKKLAIEINDDNKFNVVLQPIADMHLGKDAALPTFGDANLVQLLLILAILILTIAWINYINLSTAQSLKKAHSIAVKKVIGAKRGQLIGQQLIETFLLTTFSITLAIVGCTAIQPFFNYLVDFSLDFSLLLNWKSLTGIIAFLLLTTLASGFYVAVVLTNFAPSDALKSSFVRSVKGIFVRKTLVTTQFVITIAFIAGTFIMLMQINYLQNKDLGIEADGRLAILGPSDFSKETIESRNVFLDRIEQIPYVDQYSAAGGIPGRGINFSFSASKDRERAADVSDSYSMVFIDENYFDVFAIDMIIGNPPTSSLVNTGWWDSKKLYINETAARQLGFETPAEAFQQFLHWEQGGNIASFEIAGVVEDYNHRSLHADMMPMVFGPGRNHVWFTLKIEGETDRTQLSELEALYKEHFPKSPFIYQFVDEYFRQYYSEERRLGQLISIATLLVIIISCLGLFGLVTHSVEQRTKEIGIRKVLGASVSSIVSLLSKDFLKLIPIALIIASPIAWYAMQQWLQNFAYRIEIQWWVFALAGVAAISIAFLTVSFQSVRAALANPVESLRSE